MNSDSGTPPAPSNPALSRTIADLCVVGPLPAGLVQGYEVLELLGRGGMGVVYKARQVGLGRVVALKMIPHAGHAGQQELARFLAEAEAVAQLQPPNVVSLYEAGQHAGLPYFTLELMAGGSLAD